jgi:hypothetical protein
MKIPVQFSPRWKEELVCSVDGKSFVIEFSMGSAYHAYLPEQERWEAVAPDWAKPLWEQVRDDLTRWCEGQRIKLTIDSNSWVTFDP